MNVSLEYCIMRENLPQEPHRGPMSEEDAEQWIREWIADGGRWGLFYIAAREVGPWSPV